jgi:acetyl-CoA acetyltransferase
LLAPAIAIPKCLKKANLKIEEIDFFEIHEGKDFFLNLIFKLLQLKFYPLWHV